MMELIDQLKMEVKLRNISDTKEVQSVISEKLVEIYQGDEEGTTALNIQEDGFTVILFVGVNGVGKTTTIGKLAHKFKAEGKSVYSLLVIHSVQVQLNSWRYGENVSVSM